MDLYEWIVNYRELFLLVYTLLIGMVCLIIVIRTDRLFRLSMHQGIRYFRNAFFFYGLAFISRYFLGTINANIDIMKFVFEFFIIMAGFFLLYSLLWKRLEYPKKESFSSLLNLKILVFYLLALIIAILDSLWVTYCFMFWSQIISFIYASIISGINQMKNGGRGFSRVYFVVIFLNLIAWTLNFLVATFFHWSQKWVINLYILNLLIFLLFLYGVIKVTRKSDKS